MLGQQQQQRKTYLTINHGKVVQGSGEQRKLFSYVEGTLRNIYTKQSQFGKETVVRWFIELEDGAELYCLCLPYSSGVFKSIILSLAGSETLTASTLVRIKPYEGSNGYTKVVVSLDGVKCDWITKQLPPKQTVTIGGRTITDDTKQMELIISFVDKVKERIRK